MTYVVTETCIKCKYTDCVEVCPVDCFYEGPEFLVIDPDECIDCGLCEPECPIEAIFADDELPEDQIEFIEINLKLSEVYENITESKEPLPDAEKFVDYVITRDATKISPMRARYVILCNAYGGVLNDPILLRISKDEFWFSLSDSDIGLYLQGVNADERFNVEIDEIDVSPVQIQGPKSKALMKDLCGDHVDFDNMPFYGLAEAKVGGRSVVISQSGFSGEAGYEIYLRESTLYAEDMWNAVLEAGKKHNLMVIAPAHHRRIQAGILSWGQDMDNQHNPFQCNLGYQVSLSGKGEWDKKGDYVGKKALEKMKADIKAGQKPYKLQLVGLELGGKPIEEYAPDFWLISGENGGEPIGFITSPWYHPEKKQNIAMGYVPFDGTLNANGFPKGKVGTKYKVHLPEKYSDTPGQPVDAVVVDIPFKESYNANTREVVKG